MQAPTLLILSMRSSSTRRCATTANSGLLRFTVGTDEYDAGAGTLVMVPPGVPHTFANPVDEPAHMLSTFTPAGYAAYFRELRDTPPDRLEALMARYATVVTDQYAP